MSINLNKIAVFSSKNHTGRHIEMGSRWKLGCRSLGEYFGTLYHPKRLAQPSLEKPKTQLLGNACETAKHHLKPSSGTAKNRTCGGARTAPLEPPKKKKSAPVHRQNTWRSRAWRSRKRSSSAMHAKQRNTT